MKEIFDWSKIVQDWYKPLQNILEHKNMTQLMYELFKEYHKKDVIVYPDPKLIFRAFKECSYNNLKVVILGQDPYSDKSFTGIAFANENRKPPEYSPSLKKIQERVSTDFHDGDIDKFDPTLLSWAKQGVLLLNSALTVRKGTPGSHAKLWESFMHIFLKTLNKAKSNIFYCFWGKYSQNFSENICKSDNFLLTCTHPAYACYRHIIWECDNFQVINKKLKEIGKKTIKW